MPASGRPRMRLFSFGNAITTGGKTPGVDSRRVRCSHQNGRRRTPRPATVLSRQPMRGSRFLNAFRQGLNCRCRRIDVRKEMHLPPPVDSLGQRLMVRAFGHAAGPLSVI